MVIVLVLVMLVLTVLALLGADEEAVVLSAAFGRSAPGSLQAALLFVLLRFDFCQDKL